MLVGIGAEIEEGEFDVFALGGEAPFKVAPFFVGTGAHGEGEVAATEVGAGAVDVVHFSDDVVALGEFVVCLRDQALAVEVVVLWVVEINSSSVKEGSGEVDELDEALGCLNGDEFFVRGEGDDGAAVGHFVGAELGFDTLLAEMPAVVSTGDDDEPFTVRFFADGAEGFDGFSDERIAVGTEGVVVADGLLFFLGLEAVGLHFRMQGDKLGREFFEFLAGEVWELVVFSSEEVAEFLWRKDGAVGEVEAEVEEERLFGFLGGEVVGKSFLNVAIEGFVRGLRTATADDHGGLLAGVGADDIELFVDGFDMGLLLGS